MHQKSAFSLVELSIVLVILGLLTGGVLTGQALIRASELRSVTTKYTQIQTAVRTFRDKYFALPGDMNNAVRFWGAQAGATTDGVDATCAALTSASPATGAATCNGNGNGQLSSYWGSTAATTYEYYRFWQHLANAGLIEGTYTGVSAGATTVYTLIGGTNAMAGKMSNTIYGVSYIGTCSSCSGGIYDGNYGNLVLFGGTTANNFPYGTVLKPEEAWNIDTKMDDGLPAFGAITATKSAGACTSSATAAGATYQLTNSNQACYLFFLNAF